MATSRLNCLPESQRNEKTIQAELAFELKPGVHTYHVCSCGRRPCRRQQCSLCWRESLNELKQQPVRL